MKVAYTIHKVGTPKLANHNGRLVSAGKWWHGTGWGDSDNTAIYDSPHEVDLPKQGEWVEIYLNETTEGNN